MAKELQTVLSAKELALVQEFANQHGLTLDEAATELASKALEQRMRRSTHRSPARNIVKMRRK